MRSGKNRRLIWLINMKKRIKECLYITVGSFFVAWGLNIFLVPFQLSSGGIGTLGVVLLYFFKIPTYFCRKYNVCP